MMILNHYSKQNLSESDAFTCTYIYLKMLLKPINITGCWLLLMLYPCFINALVISKEVRQMCDLPAISQTSQLLCFN